MTEKVKPIGEIIKKGSTLVCNNKVMVVDLHKRE